MRAGELRSFYSAILSCNSHGSSSLLAFWGTSILFSIVTTPISIPTNSELNFPFLHILANTWYCILIVVVLREMEVISYCGFDLHFPMFQWCWASFHVSVAHLYIFFGEIFIQVLCPFLNKVAYFLILNFIISLYILNINLLKFESC